MRYNSTLFLLLIALLQTFSSCKREQEVDDESQTSTDYSYCKMGFGTMIPITNNITVNEEGVRELSVYSCASITLFSGDTTNWPANLDTLVYEVDYGTACVDHDGRLKQGKLWVSFISDYANQGGQVIIIPDLYKVDGIEYQGEIHLRNDGNYQFTQTIIGGKCLASDWTILYEGTTTTTWLNGYGTPADPNDDIYQVSENSTGTNRNNRSFSVATVTPIIKKSNCKWITSGIIDLTPSGLATRRIDFGAGDCDPSASITINGNTFNFEMQ
jgi:hypothetical protein